MKDYDIIKSKTMNVVCIIFKDEDVQTDFMLRPTEFFESFRFSGKKFSREEFEEHYKKQRNSKHFTYSADWRGHNLDSKKLAKFFNVFFGRLSKEEKELLDICFGNKIIARKGKTIKSNNGFLFTYREGEDDKLIQMHEFSHAMYFLNPEYRKEVKSYWRTMPRICRDSWRRGLRATGGYDHSNSNLIIDEFQAYMTSGYEHVLVGKKALTNFKKPDANVLKKFKAISKEIIQLKTKFATKRKK